MGIGDRSSKLRAGLKKTALDAKISAGAKTTAKKNQQHLGGGGGGPADSEDAGGYSHALCAICKNLPSGPSDPVMPSGCEHMFCKACLVGYVKVYRKCPECGVDANNSVRTDIGVYMPLKELTYDMRGIDLVTNVRQGDECDHPHGISHASVLDEPAIRPGPPPPAPAPRHTPRALSRQGIPAPSSSHLGWGALPPNPAPLVAGNHAFESGCTIASPCGEIVDRRPKDNSGWKNAALPTAPDIDEETGAMFIDKSGDGIINADEMVFVEADQDDWQRAWVGARRAESKVRHAKLVSGRVDLCYRQMGTPYKPDLASRVAAVEGSKGRKPAGEKIARPTGSPPWRKGPCEQLKLFTKKPRRPRTSLAGTPAAFMSPIKQCKAKELAEWNDDALCEGGKHPSPRRVEIGNELWRTEIKGDLIRLEGALLSDYPFASAGAQKPKGRQQGRQSRTAASQRSHSSLSAYSRRGSTGFSEASQRARTPGEMWSTGDMRVHHSKGLDTRAHTGCNRGHNCASAQLKPSSKKMMLPMPMARIPSRASSATRTGNKDMVLPRRTNQFQKTTGLTNVWSQKDAVTPKPEYEVENPIMDFKMAMDGFETNLNDIYQNELETRIAGWLGVSKPAKADPNKPMAPQMAVPEDDEQAALEEEWELYEALVPLVEKLSCGRAATFEQKLQHVIAVFGDMDKGWKDRADFADGGADDGKVSLKEFTAMLTSLDVTISGDRVLKAFQLFDRNNNGFLDQSELLLAMDKLERHALGQSSQVGNSSPCGLAWLIC